MATNPLGTRLSNNIRAERDRLAKKTTHTESVVNDQWNSRFVSNIRNGLEIWDVELRVTNCLTVNSSGVLIDCFFDIFWILPFDEFADDVELLHINPELLIHQLLKLERRSWEVRSLPG